MKEAFMGKMVGEIHKECLIKGLMIQRGNLTKHCNQQRKEVHFLMFSWTGIWNFITKLFLTLFA